MKKGKREKLSRLEHFAQAYNHIKARCQYFGECGGCLTQNMSYTDQVALKRDLINAAFEKAGLTERLARVTPSPEQWYYRNRMDYPVGENGEIGLKPFGKWRDVIDLKECFILSKESPEILQLVRDWMNKWNLPGWNNVRYTGYVRYVVIREGKFTNERLIMIVTAADTNSGVANAASDVSADSVEADVWADLVKRLKPYATTILHGINPGITDISIPEEYRTLVGEPHFTERINGHTYKIYPSSFFQTNSYGAELLQQKVSALATGERVLDLYCGLGFFSIDFASKGKKVLGVEIDERAIEVARENAELNNVVGAEFHASAVEDWLKTGGDERVKEFNPDTIVLDPPRMGLHPRVVDWVRKQTARELIYVSCNFEQFVKEYAEIQKAYKIESLDAVDMFPHTPHVELIVRLIHI